MQQEQFTKAPWKVMYATDTKGVCCLAVWPDHTVEGTTGNPICKVSPESDENVTDKANAHLIAAAPDMYEALKKIIKAESFRTHFNPLDPIWDALTEAKAALNKANPPKSYETKTK